MNLKELTSNFLEKIKQTTPINLLLLKKQKLPRSILYKDKDTDEIKSISSEEFYKIFEVEYLPNLFFQDLSTLKRIVNKAKKEVKKGGISEKEIWLGTYFEEDIATFSTSSVYIKYIDPIKGFGLFAARDLKKDSYIGEYTGVVRKYRRWKDDKNSYCFEYKIGDSSIPHFTIDAKYMGNVVRFINHSNQPNLSTFAAYSGGVIHIIMKTNKLIPKDSELTYDYGTKYWKKREKPI